VYFIDKEAPTSKFLLDELRKQLRDEMNAFEEILVDERTKVYII
jgi:hypothetical protein